MPGLILPEMDIQATPASAKVPEYGFVVSHQKLDMDIDFSSHSITGTSTITILPQTRNLRCMKIDARQCRIEKVEVNGKEAYFKHTNLMDKLDLENQPFEWGLDQFEMQRERLKPLTSDVRANGSLLIDLPKEVRVDEVDPFSDNAASAVTQRAIGASAVRSSSLAIEGTNGPLSAMPSFTPRTAAEQSARFQPLVLTITFSNDKFREGLQWVGMGPCDGRYPHVYTRHSLDSGTASCIFPCIDDPAMRCTWEIAISCSRTLGDALKPKHKPMVKKGQTNGAAGVTGFEEEILLNEDERLLEMTVVCSGDLMNETTHLEDSSKKVVSFMCPIIVAAQHIGFAVGPFEQVDLSDLRDGADEEKLGQEQSRAVLGYCLPNRGDEVKHTCAAIPYALDHFTLTFGSYPFSEYRIVFVDDQQSDSEHTASLSIFNSRLLYGERIQDTEIETTRTLVHAIASQWIGVAVVANQKCDRWVIVGLSHYMAGTLMKALCGHNEFSFRQKILSDQLVDLDIDRPGLYALGEILHLGSFEISFMTLKAPLVMFILDKRIMKNSGSAGLVRVLSKIIMAANTGTSADSVLSTEGFRRHCEKTTRYRQTDSFWSQWVFGAGCPRFLITQKFNKKRLCVEMTISQKQETLPTVKKLEKSSFRREVKEDIHGVYAGEIQPVFTGPMTIRIHEADGTPYEHIVEIRESVEKIEIPYNTKYKRLKRSRRNKERLLNADVVDADGAGEDALYYSLGDVLMSDQEQQDWGLSSGWDLMTQAKMDAESYEWIRVDADFEWLCHKNLHSMPAYMFMSQLQQDRDVVAQQESMVYLKQQPADSRALAATFLLRTMMDSRYYHGIRTMAAEGLAAHADPIAQWAGLKFIKHAYEELYCQEDKTPRSNDFADKQAYLVEMAIARSLSTMRDTQGKCPKHARDLLLEMLRFNDNAENAYSDNFKIANLLSCLAESLISKVDTNNALHGGMEDSDEDPEFTKFKKDVIGELDRYGRMDEWADSYQNIFTATVLDCKQRLMKAKVIPVDIVEFAKYVLDGTLESVRVKAFEGLIDLGLFRNEKVMKLLLLTLSTDPSPWTRNRLSEVLYLALADVAYGENKPVEPPKPANDGLAFDGGDGDLIMDQTADDAAVELRKAYVRRTTSIDGALAALREELKGNKAFRDALWKAVKSDCISLHEQVDLLDICSTLMDSAEPSMLVTMRVPRYWSVQHTHKKGTLVFKQDGTFRTTPSKAAAAVQAARLVQATEPVPIRPSIFVAAQPPKAPAYKAPNPIRLSLSTGQKIVFNTAPKDATPKVFDAPVHPKLATPNGVTTNGILTPKPPKEDTPKSHEPALKLPKEAASKLPKHVLAKLPKDVSMKPPKRPAPSEFASGPGTEKRRRLIAKLPIKNTDRLARILSKAPNPAPRPVKAAKSASPASRAHSVAASPRPSPGPMGRTSSTISSSSAPSRPSSSPAPMQAGFAQTPKAARKPLPDSSSSSVRKPLPDSSSSSLSSSARKPLPGTAPPKPPGDRLHNLTKPAKVAKSPPPIRSLIFTYKNGKGSYVKNPTKPPPS